jgi:ferrochelatase
MAYGSPPDLGQGLANYYTHVRRGRPPSPEQLEDLRRRYQAVGGPGSLLRHASDQAAALARRLEAEGPGRYLVRLGCKHSPPFLEDALEDLARAGAGRAVAIVLAPHYSDLSVGEYLERAARAAGYLGVELAAVKTWHLEPGLVDLLAQRCADCLEGLARAGQREAELVFSAHSLPARILDTGDPYPGQLAETARAVAQRLGLSRWHVAWQSAGRTPEPWLGPDLAATLERLAAGGAGAVAVCPAGFTSDHLEILYDIDVEAQALAQRLGLVVARTRSLNDDPGLIEVLAGLVLRSEASSGPPAPGPGLGR